jgi:acyl dehydratase
MAARSSPRLTARSASAAVSYPLTVYRLVMAADGTRDFNSIHHNGEYARSTGAPDMYASTAFLLGIWERAVRCWIGNAGTIRSIRGPHAPVQPGR